MNSKTSAAARLPALTVAAVPAADAPRRAPTSIASGRTALVCLAIVVLLSAVLMHPSVGRLWRSRPIETVADEMLQYFGWGLAVGLSLLGCALAIGRIERRWFGNLVLSYTILASLFLSDRFLLAKFGTPLWVHDANLNFRYRASAIRDPFENKVRFQTNRYGFLDEEFELAKRPGELRGMSLGNVYFLRSGTSKAGPEEVFTEQLEQLVEEARAGKGTSQVIHAGILGHAPREAVTMLEETRKFQPDFLVYAFQGFQIYDYYLVDKRYGGPGIDFRRVMQTSNPFVGYLANETGYGRLMNELRFFAKNAEMAPRFGGRDGYWTLKNLDNDPILKRAWSGLLADVARICDFARQHRLPLALLIVPYQNQILNREQLDAFAELRRVGEQGGATVLDMTEPLRKVVFDPNRVASLKARSFSDDTVTDVSADALARYLAPLNDLTAAGHRMAAEQLLLFLRQKGLVP